MLENIEIEEENIENMIYEIRGKQVMLDSDLAKLYKCKNGTREINQTVKRNIKRFPAEFYFQLSMDEYKYLMSQFVTSNNNYGGVRKLPHVFTEQGVAMIAGMLNTEIAITTSIKIINAFVRMRHYIGNNELRLSNVETKLIEHDKNIRLLQESFEKFEEKKKINDIYFNGQIFDAYYAIYKIFNKAKKSLIIVDNYADNSLLDIIRRLDVDVVLITKKDGLLSMNDIEIYNKQYNNLKIVYNNMIHDRFFIIDSSVLYHCGTSVNRIGYKTFAINLFTDIETSKLLIDRINKIVEKCVDFRGQ